MQPADANTNGLVTYELVSGEHLFAGTDDGPARLCAADSLTYYKLSVRAMDEVVHSQRKSTGTRLTIISVRRSALYQETVHWICGGERGGPELVCVAPSTISFNNSLAMFKLLTSVWKDMDADIVKRAGTTVLDD